MLEQFGGCFMLGGWDELICNWMSPVVSNLRRKQKNHGNQFADWFQGMLGLLRSKNTSFQTTIWIGCLPLIPAISELCDPKVQGSGLRSTAGLGNLVPNPGGSAQDQRCLCGEWLGVSGFVGRSCWDSDVSWFLATCCLEKHWTSLNFIEFHWVSLNFIEIHWSSFNFIELHWGPFIELHWNSLKFI